MYRLKVIELREEKHLTQRQLSKLSKVSRSYISEIERGLHYPTMEVMIKICFALEVSPNELLDWESLIKNYRASRRINRWKKSRYKKAKRQMYYIPYQK